jgi:hypothetical protein
MSALRSALLLCSLVVAVVLTLAWDSFLSYEFFRFAESSSDPNLPAEPSAQRPLEGAALQTV